MANLKLALYVNFSYTAASPEKGLLQDGNKTRYLLWCCLTQLQFHIQDINFDLSLYRSITPQYLKTS